MSISSSESVEIFALRVPFVASGALWIGGHLRRPVANCMAWASSSTGNTTRVRSGTSAERLGKVAASEGATWHTKCRANVITFCRGAHLDLVARARAGPPAPIGTGALSTLPIPNGLFLLQLTASGLRASASPRGNETPLLQNVVFDCDGQTLK